MQDNFDKKLSERIQHVFNLYEDDSADLGWKELRKKYPEKKVRSPFVYWLGSAAAALLLIAGTWLLVDQTSTNQKMDKNKGQTISKNVKEIPHYPDAPIRTPVPQAVQVSSGTKHPKFIESGVNDDAPITSGLKNVPEEISIASAILDSSGSAMNSGSNMNKEPAALQQPIKESDIQAYKEPDAPKKNLSSATENYDDLQRAKNAMLSNNKAPIAKVKKDAKLSFSLFAGSHVSYAEGSKSSMNTGVGVSSELGITRNLKFSTGLSLAQNTLKYNKKIPEQVASSFITSSSSRISNLMVAGPETKTSAINYSINGYDASLLGLDVPINLKYTVFQKENELYIVAGLSSNFFFDETYTYAYGYNSLEENSFQVHPDETTTTSSSTFDFARMLNLSVGYGYPIGKQSKLSLEPFLKYPLGGLGAQNLRFGAAGLNLKWSFVSR